MRQLKIGFHGKSLTIESDSTAIISHLQHRFKHLCVEGDVDSVKIVTISRYENGNDLDQSDPGITALRRLRQLEYEIMDTLITANGEYLWFHAGAVARAGQAILFVGKSGCGKSTLSLGLCAQEPAWHFLGDDAIPFRMEPQSAYAFLRTPWYRQGNGQEIAPERLWELKKQDVEIDEAMVWQGPARLGLVIFPVYKHGAPLCIERVSGMDLAWNLLNCSVNIPVHGAKALQFVSQVASNTPAFRILYSDSREAIHWVNDLGAQVCSHTTGTLPESHS